MNFSEQTNPNSKTIRSGSQHLKILENPRNTLQYRQESSRNWTNSRKERNSIHKRAQNLETNFSNVLIGLQSKRLRNLFRDSVLSCGLSFSLSLSSFNSLRILACIGVCSSGFPGFSGVGNQNVLSCCSDLFVLRSSFKYAVMSGSSCGIILRIAISTGLMCLDCSGVTTENSAICVCFLIRYGDSVVLVTLTAILLSIIVDIEWEISKLAVSVNFSNGVTVPVVFHFEGWSMNAVTVFVVAGGIVRSASMMTGSCLVVVSLEAVFTCLHGEFGKHPGIFKTITACREKYYFPKMAQLIREWVNSCEQCIRESRIDPNLTRPSLQNPNEHITAPEDAIQIDLVPELPPSGGYENIVTAMDVFSRYLFAYPTANQDAKTIAKVLINIMTKHAYLPTTLISDKGTAFTSHVIKEVAGVLGVTLKHATTKHAQTIGLLERSHASIKKSIEDWDRRTTITLAQIHQHCSPQLQHFLSHKYWLWAKPSFSWQNSLQYSGFRIGNSPPATAYSHFAKCPRSSWTNRNDLPRCAQEY